MYYDDASVSRQSSPFLLIAVSLFLALALEFAPWPGIILQYKPLFPVLALVYWALYGSYWVGYVAAAFIGVMIDLSTQSPLGFHVASCSVVVFLTLQFSRRFVLFGTAVQAMHVFVILAFGQGTIFMLGWFETSSLPVITWEYFIPSLSAAILWLLLPLLMRKLREFISGRYERD